MKANHIVISLFLVVLLVGCTTKSSNSEVKNQELLNQEDFLTTTFFSTFKEAYNAQDISALKNSFEPTLQNEITDFSLIKGIVIYQSINSLKILSEDITSTTGTIEVSINNDAKPTSFQLKIIEEKMYITDIKSGKKLMDSAKAKSPHFSILESPTLSSEGSLKIKISYAGENNISTFKIISGAGNCNLVKAEKLPQNTIKLGDSFELIIKCSPKNKGENFLSIITFGYTDQITKEEKELLIEIKIYDR